VRLFKFIIKGGYDFKKIKNLNVGNFAVVGDIFCGKILASCEKN
jgi:hypothetical protein